VKCGATFRYHDDELEHRCFGEADHDQPHRCICIDRLDIRVRMPKMDEVLARSYGPDYYDRDGKPLPMCTWATLFEDREEYGRVAKTQVGQWWISTVWLGMNHAYGNGPPLIFETMVFWQGPHGAERDYDNYQARYTTLAQARRGHAQAVREYRRRLRTIPPFPVTTCE
jgi:hypothetical protein